MGIHLIYKEQNQMKEYTILAIVSVGITILLDMKTGMGILKKGQFYIYLVIIYGFKFLVNGYLTGKGIVMYNSRFFLGLRIGPIPVEDFLFGFSMVTMSIIFWEYFKSKFR
jgi:lycopene cyclase domain-containing protein